MTTSQLLLLLSSLKNKKQHNSKHQTDPLRPVQNLKHQSVVVFVPRPVAKRTIVSVSEGGSLVPASASAWGVETRSGSFYIAVTER